MNEKKRTLRAKLKAACKEERLLKWKEHFKNLLENPPEIIDSSIQNIINGQLDVKLGQFMEEELDAVLKKKIKNSIAVGFDNLPSEV